MITKIIVKNKFIDEKDWRGKRSYHMVLFWNVVYKTATFNYNVTNRLDTFIVRISKWIHGTKMRKINRNGEIKLET